MVAVCSLTQWLNQMAAPRRIIDIPFDRDELTELESLARSRTAPAN
jgi:hypothetical protein